MLKTPTIPKIISAELIGFRPIFKETIKINVGHNRFLILGGNGLGKTTILQSIIYCIAGEADISIENQKRNRWGRKFFTDRLDGPNSATVRVDLLLGQDKVILQRGFRTKQLTGFAANGNMIHYDSKRPLEQEFEKFLINEHGYYRLDDFRFMVHKLCYLSEKRSSLVWDAGTQVRLFMLLFGDIINETEFRGKRGNLKELDSRMRHINVAINKKESQLQSLHAFAEDTTKDDDEVATSISTKEDYISEENFKIIFEKINSVAAERMSYQNKIKSVMTQLSDLTIELEGLQDKLAEAEEHFILKHLRQLESKEVSMAMHKLLNYQLCPACGSKAADFSNLAQQFIMEQCCPLCGSGQKKAIVSAIPSLDAESSEKIQNKVLLEEDLLKLEMQLASIVAKEELLQMEYDKFRLKKPIDSSDYEVSNGDKKGLESELRDLKADHRERSLRFKKLQSELDKKYKDFNKMSLKRIEILEQLYQNYATAFLGISCELIKYDAKLDFVNLNLYVPKFNSKARNNPDTCSEAQRFFLDIAFRMAMIDLAKELSGFPGSFICETPESALDITYINNVAGMFKSFTNQNHTLLATSNLQPGSLAGPMLSDYSGAQKQKSILNLLKYGVLSKIQSEGRSDLEKQLKIIINYRDT